MRLYVNGDSHTAAAEAVNSHAFAEDDSRYFYLGRAPHPDNLAVSWSRRLADTLKSALHNEAESASSNPRIIRTTQHWIANNAGGHGETLMIIQWSTWEREEWQNENGTYFQVNASGIDQVPENMQARYKQFVADVDWDKCVQAQHDLIWEFHTKLVDLGIKHIFFNGNTDFGKIQKQHDWGNSYIGPYDPKSTYSSILTQNGFETVSPTSWHFGKDAHSFWNRFMLQYIITHKLIS